MHDIAAIVDSLGGITQKKQLVARGARDLDLTRAVRDGAVTRARQGWYTTLPESDRRVRAIRVGGRLTGISAVIQAGGWVLGEHPLHVAVPANAARLRSQENRRVRFDTSKPGGVVLHWDAIEVGERGPVSSVGLSDALYRVVLNESLETAVAALDWALRTQALDQIDFEQLLLRLPQDCRPIGNWVDGACDSLPESLVRTRLRLRGHVVVSQVTRGDAKHIDLVVDDCVAVEADGEEHHAHRFDHDRRKDIHITIERLHVIRPTALMIFYEWDLVLLAIETAISERHPDRAIGNSGYDPSRRLNNPGFLPRPQKRRRPSPEFPKPRRRR